MENSALYECALMFLTALNTYPLRNFQNSIKLIFLNFSWHNCHRSIALMYTFSLCDILLNNICSAFIYSIVCIFYYISLTLVCSTDRKYALTQCRLTTVVMKPCTMDGTTASKVENPPFI